MDAGKFFCENAKRSEAAVYNLARDLRKGDWPGPLKFTRGRTEEVRKPILLLSHTYMFRNPQFLAHTQAYAM